ncbi:hypothetical protein EDB19DRAFT_1201758 [Suillus lakei]|nr:hypothetical protein EDB19DRAFT_1201758 [Suillus lakei]
MHRDLWVPKSPTVVRIVLALSWSIATARHMSASLVYRKSASQHLDKLSNVTVPLGSRKSPLPCFVPIKNVLQANPDVIRLCIHNVTLGVLDDPGFVHTLGRSLKSVHNAEELCPQRCGPQLWMETAE